MELLSGHYHKHLYDHPQVVSKTLFKTREARQDIHSRLQVSRKRDSCCKSAEVAPSLERPHERAVYPSRVVERLRQVQPPGHRLQKVNHEETEEQRK